MTVSRNYGGAVREVQVLENLRGADLDVLVNTTCSICHHMFVCMYVCMYVWLIYDSGVGAPCTGNLLCGYAAHNIPHYRSG